MSTDRMDTVSQGIDTAGLLRKARERFQEAETAWSENRKLALDDDKHLNGEQWPQEVLEERKGRPCLTINRLPGFVDQVVGDQRQNRPRIKVRPVDDKSDTDTATILEGLIRNIEYTSCADNAYDTAFENAANHGFGYFRILKDYASHDTFDQDLKIARVRNSYSVLFDPQAQEVDYSDARYCFVFETISKDEFKERFPNATMHSFEALQTGDLYEGWFLSDSVRIAEYWERIPTEKTIVLLSNGIVMPKDDLTDEKIRDMSVITEMGVIPPRVVRERIVRTYRVQQYIISGNEILDGPKEWDDECIPIVPVIGKELIVDGKPILRGVIRNAKDSQRMYNYWKSISTETIALAPKAPFIVTPEQIEGHETLWGTAHRKSLPYLLYNHTGAPFPQRQFPATMPQGAFTEAQSAVDDMKATTGIYDASLGNRSNETSGKAIMARQREGDVATFVFIDNLSRAIQHAGRILVRMIPKVYDTERVIRIMNIDGTNKQIPINRPGLDRQGLPVILNDITVGKYDVVVEAGPSYTTQRQEAAESILRFMQASPSQAPLIADLAAKSMDWPYAQEIAVRLKKTLPPGLGEPEEGEQPQPQKPNPAMMLEQEKLKLEYAKIELEKFKIQAEVEKERLKYAMAGQRPVAPSY